MTYIFDMAGGKPYPDDEPAYKCNAAAQPRRPELITETGYALPGLASIQSAPINPETPPACCGVNVAALIVALED